MELDVTVQEALQRSNSRFVTAINSILERYNHPFEDDLLVSLHTLTYDTPDGPKRWGQVSRKGIKKWKNEIVKQNRHSQRNRGRDNIESWLSHPRISHSTVKIAHTVLEDLDRCLECKTHKKEISEQQSSDFEDEHSTVHQESSENSGVDTSDIGEKSDIVSVRKKFEDFHLQNLNVDDGQVQKKERVRVDMIVQDDERNIPKWITNLNVDDGQVRKKERVRVDMIVQDDERNIPKWITYLNVDDGQVQKKERVRVDMIVQDDERNIPKWITNLDVDDGQVRKKERVRVDMIVQDDERNIPKWITITPPGLSKSCLTSPVQESIGHQGAVCRKKLELSNEFSSSNYLQLQHFDVPTSSSTITTPRHQPCLELSKTLCDSIHGDYQSADEECSWSNTTLADLYPAMLEIFKRLMAKRSHRKLLKYMFGHSRSKRWHSRQPKLNVTLDNIRGLGNCKEKVFQSISSYGSEDKQNPAVGNESRECCYDNCLISNSSGLAPYAYTDTNAIKMDYCDSSLEQHVASGKGQNISKHTAFPDVMAGMGETFLVEDELQTALPKNSEYTESEKMAYKHFSEYSFITSPASSDSRAFHLVKDSKTQKTDFSCVETSELCSSACSSHGNSNNSIPLTNYSPARSSNTVLMYPEKIIPERQTSFQHKHSFSSWFMKHSPSKMHHEYEDAFEELYHKVCSEEFQKSLTLTRPVLNSQNLEEKGRLVKSNSSDFMRSTKQCDTEFDRLYEQLCGKPVPKFPGFQRASNLRKYEEIQMPETVNALVNSPVRAYSAISRVKRAGNFQNYLPCSPTKRLKLIPARYFPSGKCQEISHSKKDSGFHDSSDKSFLGIPGTSLQESGTAGAYSCWPGAMENYSSPRNVRKCHKRCTEN